MRRRNLVLLSACLLSMPCLQGCGGGKQSEGVLVVGMECTYAPFNWTETEKTDTNIAIANIPNAYAQGYDVQVARKIAEGLGLELQIKAIGWEGLVPALTSGEIDAIIAGMSPTEDRKQTIDFTDGYYRSTHVLLLKDDSIYANATSLDDFNGANIIGQTGTLFASLIPQVTAHGAIAGTNLDTVPKIVNAILMGTADITILEEPVAKGIIGQYEGLTYVKIDNAFEVNDEDVTVSIGVRKEYEYTSQMNDILTSVLTNDIREQLMLDAINNAPSEE